MPIKTFLLSLIFSIVSMVGFSQERTSGFELVSFQGRFKENTKISLSWVTMAKQNASHFIMQRSADGTHFSDAALLFIKEGGVNVQTDYHYADPIKPGKSGMVYYRLKMVDADGKFTYSAPIRIYVQKQGGDNEFLYTTTNYGLNGSASRHA